MSTYLDDNTLLRAPAFSVTRLPDGSVALDPSAPNWIVTDDRGLQLLGRFDGRTPFGQVVKEYAAGWCNDLGAAAQPHKPTLFSPQHFIP